MGSGAVGRDRATGNGALSRSGMIGEGAFGRGKAGRAIRRTGTEVAIGV